MQVSGAGCLLANAASSAAAKRASFQSGMVRNMNSRAHVVLVPSAGRSGCEQRGRPEPPPRLSKAYLLLTDLPNHTRRGNLDERSIRGINELAGGIGLPEVTHGAVVDEVRAIVGPELEVHRTVDAAKPIHERLLERRVMRKPRLLELKRLTLPAEVH